MARALGLDAARSFTRCHMRSQTEKKYFFALTGNSEFFVRKWPVFGSITTLFNLNAIKTTPTMV